MLSRKGGAWECIGVYGIAGGCRGGIIDAIAVQLPAEPTFNHSMGHPSKRHGLIKGL